MHTQPNPANVLIGWFRDDGDFEVIAAVKNSQFADDGQTIRALLAVIQSNMADSESIVAIERDEVVDVVSLEEGEATRIEAWQYQPQLFI